MIDTSTIPDYEMDIPDEPFRIDGTSFHRRTTRIPSEEKRTTDLIDVKTFDERSFRARIAIADFHADVVTAYLGIWQAKVAGEPSRDIIWNIEFGQAEIADQQESKKWSDKLESIASLEEGWNGYRAPAPNEQATGNARGFLSIMCKCGCLPTRVGPSVIGGVGITRRKGPRKVYIEFFNNGVISALFADDKTESMFTQQIENTVEDLDGLVLEIKDYLHA